MGAMQRRYVGPVGAVATTLIALLPAARAGVGGPDARARAHLAQGDPEVAPLSAGARAEERLPFEGWDRVGPHAFEQRLRAWVEPSREFVFAEPGWAELGAAIGKQDATSVRAVLLLVSSRDPRVPELLLRRLERRERAPGRARDAGDIVAAAALAGRDAPVAAPHRLAELADGARPHPDLEVRVECARTALAAGRNEVCPFLLSVLRADTRASRIDPPDWEPTQTLAWAKSRAAEALCARAGIPCVFRPDGSFEHQEREAQRIADALRGGH